MPNMNSGTERPYAPLLEPCITLYVYRNAVGYLSFDRVRTAMKFNNNQTRYIHVRPLL